MGTKAIGLTLLLALAACTSVPALVENPRAVWCENNTPRRPTPEVVAQMTRAELDEMNAFNAAGVKWCGWRP